MLLPALSKAREMAYNITCLSNSKQQAMFHAMYTNDYNGYMLSYRRDYLLGSTTLKTVFEYLGVMNGAKDRNDIYRCTKFLKCPADRIRTTHNGVEYPSQIFTSMAIVHGSYGYNAYLWEQKSSEYAYKLTMIRKNMDKVILFADTSAISNGAIFSGTDIRSGTKKRHPKGYNACYLDGSAKNESENWQSKTTNRINVWNVDAADLAKYMNRN